MSSNSLPRWLVAVLAVLGVVFLGPPVFVLALIGLSLLVKVGVVALKVAGLALAVAAIVFVVRALLGAGRPASLPRRETSIDELASRLEAEELARREALDRELAQALQNPR